MKFSIALIALFSAATLAAPVAAPHGGQGNQAAQAQGGNQGTKTAGQGAAAASPAAQASAQPAQGATTNGQTAAAGGNKKSANKGQAGQAAAASPAAGAGAATGAGATTGAGAAAGTTANANGGQKGQGKAGAAQGAGAGKGGNTGAAATGGAAGGAAGGATAGAAAAAGESDTQAAQNWMSDTGIVSDFLNRATSLKGQAFVAAAQKALDAEKDELNHKKILDADAKLKNQVATASNVLMDQGFFQQVVDKLQEMVNVGDSSAAADTAAINANRCKNVLPNIDIYLKAAGTNLKSVRPTACGGP